MTDKNQQGPGIGDIKVLAQRNRNVYVGAWVGGFWDNKTKTLNASAAADFEQAIDKKLAITNIYSEWSYLSNEKLIVSLNDISDHGWVPMISS
ncbi:MAG: hypothetical protein ACREBJ_04950, partial [Nitrosotalea sp.]